MHLQPVVQAWKGFSPIFTDCFYWCFNSWWICYHCLQNSLWAYDILLWLIFRYKWLAHSTKVSEEMKKPSEVVRIIVLILHIAVNIYLSNLEVLSEKSFFLLYWIMWIFYIPLGILPKSDMQHEQIIQIVKHLQQYVPLKTSKEMLEVPSIGKEVEIENQHVNRYCLEGTSWQLPEPGVPAASSQINNTSW